MKNHTFYAKKIFIFTIIYLVLTSVVFSGCSSTNVFSLSTDTVNLVVGETITLNSNYSSENISWTSSDSKIATVNNSGAVTAVNAGETIITAMLQTGEKATCTVTVSEVAITSIKLSKISLTLKVNEDMPLVAELSPDNASIDNVSWASSDDSVAIVDSNGLVTAVGKGNAIIECYTASGVKARCAVTVKQNKKATQTTTQSPVTIIDNRDYRDDDTLYCRANDYASLRQYASRSSKRLAKIRCRESCTFIDGYDAEFYYVSYQGQYGYVLKDYFSFDPDAPLNHGDN